MAIDPAELSQLPNLRGFTEDELAELIALGEERRLTAGHVLYEPGTPADEAMLLVSGRLAVSIEGEGGRERNVGDVWPGEILGESAFFPGETKRTARVRVVQGGLGLALPATFMEDARGTRGLSVLQRHLVSTLARRVRSTDLTIRKVWQDLVEAEKRAAERAKKTEFDEGTMPLSLGQRLFSIFGGRK